MGHEQDIRTDVSGQEHGIGTDTTGHEQDIGTNITGQEQDIGTDIIGHEQDLRTYATVHEQDLRTDITGHEQDTNRLDCLNASSQVMMPDMIGEKRKSRKRTRNESNWIINVAKRRRNEGKSYVTRSGVIKSGKVLRDGCGLMCKRKCHTNINREKREMILHNFWSGHTYKERKKNYHN
ncbi:hypothetical protein DPMN_153031 [Dreissena polymorpha]|uniref:Uncharacterized protein n=1 Tax=Dreissena polymorpha TaxID=45954 RepID=A0A9D4FLI0_DREPO|nr:hypothetical protein DPMN_153031 [Dreissena polymorpha]